MTQDEAKSRIAELVNKYKALKKTGQNRKYNEAQVCKDFILPLFEALGWDIHGDEVSAEEHTATNKRADYGFYLNGWPKFYLEAKKFSADIQSDKFAQQATAYSWNKGIDWAILTNFETLKVFSAQDLSEHLSHRQFFEINFNDYVDRFEQLWWLSKTAFESNVLDEEAERVGKKLQRVSVTDTLYKDLNQSREILLRSFHAWNKDIPDHLLEEGVQRFLDRLIFIRVAEDRNLEQKTLIPMLRAHHGSTNPEFFKDLVKKFRALDEIYNSNLFDRHPFEEWEEYDGATEKVIELLHGQEGYYEYNFEAIPADILGSVYENYLGYQLAQSDKGLAVAKDARKRKEHGIYYTPTYIVDYIVTKALKPVLDKCETVEDIQKIKVLDPACGSGSFLIRAMEMIFDWYKKINPYADEFTKISILQNNIFGVDLDEQAVEIARLNLLINALDVRMKLPDLSDNIKTGNSLINGTDIELRKAFGKDFRNKKPFNWEEQFPQVFQRNPSGFDVVIGNPPYLSFSGRHKTNIPQHEIEFLRNKYSSMKGWPALHSAFIELGLKISRGVVAYIVPDQVGHLEDYKELRALSVSSAGLVDVRYWGEGVFRNVITPALTFVLDKHFNGATRISNSVAFENVNLQPEEKWALGTTNPILEKVSALDGVGSLGALIGDIGVHTGNVGDKIIANEKKSGYVELLIGQNVGRYSCSKPSKFLLLSYKAEKDDYFSIRDKAKYETVDYVIRQTAPFPIVGPKKYATYFRNSLLALYRPDDRTDVRYLVGLLNSKLIRYLYNSGVQESHQKVFPQVKVGSLRKLPIKFVNFGSNEKELHDKVVSYVQKMLEANQELSRLEANSEAAKQLSSEIKRLDDEIDRLVYQLYELTPEEVKVIESQS